MNATPAAGEERTSLTGFWREMLFRGGEGADAALSSSNRAGLAFVDRAPAHDLLVQGALRQLLQSP